MYQQRKQKLVERIFLHKKLLMNLFRNLIVLEQKKVYNQLSIIMIFKLVRISEREKQVLNLAIRDQMGKVLVQPLKTRTRLFEWRISPGDILRLARCFKVGKTQKVIELIC